MSAWKLTKKLKETHLSFLPHEKDKQEASAGAALTSAGAAASPTAGSVSGSGSGAAAGSLQSPASTSTLSVSSSTSLSASPSTVNTSSAKPGLLTVEIHSAQGLSLPPGIPDLVLTPGRKPPVYLVLEYDKNQVILDCTGGTSLQAPVWEQTSSFDVSRLDSLSIQAFARVPLQGISDQTAGGGGGGGGGRDKANASSVDPAKTSSVTTGPTKSSVSAAPAISSSPASASVSGSVRQRPGHHHSASLALPRRRYEDVFLGSARISTTINHTGKSEIVVVNNESVPLSSGSGSIKLKVTYKSNIDKHLAIEDFDLLKVVGKGSFGKVMQVRKTDTQRVYALKTIRKAHIVSRSEVSHTLAERTVLAQIDNPFIVPLKFSFQSPEKLYLVLAFINGGELFHHLQREGRFDLNRSRFYSAELLCALECLHGFNVIYRDLKPENILLDYTGHIALCDFGLCKLNMVGEEKTNTFCGTPEYLAPELLLSQGYTKVVDWWTLGVLFYEMLTGLPPFYDQDTNEMYRKILGAPLRFPEDMDREARSLLTGLLNRDPKKRLGVNGAAEIKAHPFFAQIDWKRLMNKKYAAPFKPAVESATDTSNFDQEFTSEVPADSVVDKDFYLSDSVQKQFGGWTYTNNDSKLSSSAGKW